jgi:hypothetical protein
LLGTVLCGGGKITAVAFSEVFEIYFLVLMSLNMGMCG